MSLFKKSAKAFTTWKNSLKSSNESKPKQHDDYTDAMAYLTERHREAQFNEALRRINPMTVSNTAHTGQAAMNTWPHLTGAHGVGAINQAWGPGASADVYNTSNTTRQFSVEKVDNGFILRSGKYSKICKDMDDLADQFIAVMVESQLDK